MSVALQIEIKLESDKFFLTYSYFCVYKIDSSSKLKPKISLTAFL